MMAWWEGEDIDPDSGLSHVTKAIASLVVIRDAMIQNKWVDDRPPPSQSGWIQELNKKAAALIEKYPDAVMPWTADRLVDRCEAEGCGVITSEMRWCSQHFAEVLNGSVYDPEADKVECQIEGCRSLVVFKNPFAAHLCRYHTNG
jgi:hypothetical protein